MAQKEKYDGQRLPKTEEEIRAHFRHWDFFEKGVQQFAIDRGLVNYMIIKPGTGRNLGLCTHCGKWVELEEGYSREERKKWEQDSKITCPECGAPVYVLVTRSTREHSCFFYWWGRSILNPQALVCRGIHVTRKLQRSAWDDLGGIKVPDLLMELDSAAVFIHGKGSAMARAVGHYEYRKDPKDPKKLSWEKVTEMKTGTVSGRKGIYTSHSNTICIRAADNLKAAIRGTPFAWSEWEAWDKERSRVFQSDFLDYDGNGGYNVGDWNIDRELIFFARFARYPAWEYLIKMGLGKLLGKYTDKMDREVTMVLNLRGKDVDHIFRTHLTRADKRHLLKRTIDQSGILGMLQQWRRYHPEASLEDVHWIVDHMGVYTERAAWNRDDMHRVYRLVSPERLRAYVEKQDRKRGKEEEKMHAHPGGWLPGRDYGTIRMTEYRDYLQELDQLGYDMEDKDNLFPSNFQKAHEHAAKAMVALKMKQDEGKWDRRRESCREKYDFYDKEKGMKVIVPEHLSELVKEGEAMHNCVGTYIARVARADTDVVFVRRTANPEESYITVEVEPGTGRIIQAREKYNTAVKGKPARDFMAAFAVHAARAAKKYRAMGKSLKSAEEGRKAE